MSRSTAWSSPGGAFRSTVGSLRTSSFGTQLRWLWAQPDPVRAHATTSHIAHRTAERFINPRSYRGADWHYKRNAEGQMKTPRPVIGTVAHPVQVLSRVAPTEGATG